MLCLDGEEIMDTKIIETYVEKYINGNAGDVMPVFQWGELCD